MIYARTHAMGHASSKSRGRTGRAGWRGIKSVPVLGPLIVDSIDRRTLRQHKVRGDAMTIENDANIGVQDDRMRVARAAGKLVRDKMMAATGGSGAHYTEAEKSKLMQLEAIMREASKSRAESVASNVFIMGTRGIMHTHENQRNTDEFAREFARDIVNIVGNERSVRDTEQMNYNTELIVTDIQSVSMMQDGTRRSMARLHDSVRPRELDESDESDAGALAVRDNFSTSHMLLFDDVEAIASSRTERNLDAMPQSHRALAVAPALAPAVARDAAIAAAPGDDDMVMIDEMDPIAEHLQ